MKDLSEKLFVCWLYQVDKNKGYININELSGKHTVIPDTYVHSDDGEYVETIHKVKKIIVKKNNNIFKGQVKELLTGEDIDFVMSMYNGDVFNDWNRYRARGKKKEYDTFVVMGSESYTPTLDFLKEYIEDNNDLDKFSDNLKELKRFGAYHHEIKKYNDDMELKNSNKFIRSLIKK